MAEPGILTVQKRGIGLDNKELAAGAVIVIGARHGYGAPDVGDIVFHAVLGKFALDVLVGAAGAVALGISALDHKAVDDPMERKSIIKSVVGQLAKIRHGNGRGIGIQLHGDGAVVLNLELGMMEAGAVVLAAAAG